MAKQDAPVDPEVQKWLDESAISTGKADINLVVTESDEARRQIDHALSRLVSRVVGNGARVVQQVQLSGIRRFHVQDRDH